VAGDLAPVRVHQDAGLGLDAVVDAVLAGLREGEREARRAGREMTVNVILCAMRTGDRSYEIAQLLERRRYHDPKLVAFDRGQVEMKAGTILSREWNGITQRAIVVDDGFLWEETRYDSLASVAPVTATPAEAAKTGPPQFAQPQV